MSDMLTIDGAWGLYTVSHKKVIDTILGSYAEGVEVIKERDYTVKDIKHVSCQALTDYARGDDPGGTRLLGFAMYFDLHDGQRYQRLMTLRVTT